MPINQQQPVNQPKPVTPIKPATGIVNAAAKPPANEYKAPETKPVTTEVDAGQETVESRLNKLTTSGNKTLELQKNEASRDANTRGLVNSTMAVGAGRDALIRNAVPIATADAETYTETRMNNQAYENDFLKNRQSADLNKETAGYQSQLNKDETQQRSNLTNEENTLLNSLTMKRDKGLSELSQEEQAQLKELEMKRDAANSALNINRDKIGSALTNQENTLLNSLTMKRDSGLSQLTQGEQAQLKDLEMKRDAASSQLNINEAGAQSQFDINRDNNSAALNEGLAAFESNLKQTEMQLDAELRKDFEMTINDEKFSDEAKLEIVSTMDNIIRDYNQQVTDIGTSDRTADQQAVALDLAEKSRNAQLAVYQDLLKSFNDWEWGTDFTPKSTKTLAESSNYWNAPGNAKPLTEPKVGDRVSGKIYQGNGVWEDPPSYDYSSYD